MVYQRRMTVEALKTKALLLASLDPDRASKAAQEYFECAIPVDEQSREDQMRERERELEQIATAEPIKISQLRMGSAMSGTQQWGTSMHRR